MATLDLRYAMEFFVVVGKSHRIDNDVMYPARAEASPEACIHNLEAFYFTKLQAFCLPLSDVISP